MESVNVWSDRADDNQKSPMVGPPGFEFPGDYPPGVTRTRTAHPTRLDYGPPISPVVGPIYLLPPNKAQR